MTKYKKTYSNKTKEQVEKTEQSAQSKTETAEESNEVIKTVHPTKVLTNTMGRDTLISFRRSMFASKMIGSPEELIPFSWRNSFSIKPNTKISKPLKAMMEANQKRMDLNKK